jgi:two-component system phosphate regulon sensor histidine kinase PhoR
MATDSRIPIESAVLGAPVGRPTKSLWARLFFILLASFLVMIIVTAVSFGFMIHSWEGILRTEIERGLTQKAQMFASEVNDHTRSIGALTSQEGQRAGARATVVDMNGKVIADSEVRVADLDNEGRRPEFAAALHGDTGSDVRSRSTFGIPVLYVAVPVSGGAVRLAYPLADVSIMRTQVHRTLFLICVFAFVAAVAISGFAAHLISQRIGRSGVS